MRWAHAYVGLLAMLMVWTMTMPAYALDPAKSITQYNHTVWQAKGGLPQNSAYAITQTQDGYIWLGTAEGLVRFDGFRFTVFDRTNTPEMARNNVQVLYEDRAGTLWVGTYGGGLCLTVQDNGPGVPDDERTKIFDPFYTTKKVGKGTGLGLALCKRFALEMGETLELAEGTSGAQFSLKLDNGEVND